MGNSVFKRGIVLAIAGAMTVANCAGCANNKAISEAEIMDTDVALVASAASPDQMDLEKELSEHGQIFTPGVYRALETGSGSSENSVFYIFYDDETGYIQDADNDSGTYFEYSQEEYCIDFYFGFGDPYVKELKVLSVDNGAISGIFDGQQEIVFEPVEGADPFTFDIYEYKSN